LTRKQRQYLHLFLNRNEDIVKKYEAIIVKNNGLGVVRLLHLIRQLDAGKRRKSTLTTRLLGNPVLPSAFPTNYRNKAKQRKLGRRERERLKGQPGVEVP
jgi:hypothetical protein